MWSYKYVETKKAPITSAVWRSGVSEVYSCSLLPLFVHASTYERDHGRRLRANKGNTLQAVDQKEPRTTLDRNV